MKDIVLHPLALCESRLIGAGTRLAAFSHVMAGAKIGSNCAIQDYVFVGSEVVIGDRAVIQSGTQIRSNVIIEDDVIIGGNVNFSESYNFSERDDKSRRVATNIQRRSIIQDNSTIFQGVTVGFDAIIAAGTVVKRDIPPKAIAEGNPARIIGYSNTIPNSEKRTESPVAYQPIRKTSVQGVTLHSLHNVLDMRGNLTVAELGSDVPFDAKRFFLVHDVPSIESRGEHAHHRCAQFLVAVKGSLHVVADDGIRREEFVLDRPSLGLFLPPMIWGIQYRYSLDAVLLVIASEHYDAQDYIRSYNEYLDIVGSKK